MIISSGCPHLVWGNSKCDFPIVGVLGPASVSSKIGCESGVLLLSLNETLLLILLLETLVTDDFLRFRWSVACCMNQLEFCSTGH